MIRLLKKYFQQIKYKIFNNKLSIYTNFLHEVNNIASIFIYRITTNRNKTNLKECVQLKKDGFIIIKNNDQDQIKNFRELSLQISNFFNNRKNLIISNNLISYLDPKFLDQEKLKKIFTPYIIKFIENYFKSSFQIYSYHIYRTDFTRNDKEDSYLWHTDNSTRHSLKLMFYLNDVKKSDGAMEILNSEDSKAIFKKGFYDRSQQNQYESLITPKINVCEGDIGSVIIFKNSLNLHRAKKPLNRSRDVINVNIYPSIKKFSENCKKELNKEFYNSGFSLNPFTNYPQNTLSSEKI